MVESVTDSVCPRCGAAVETTYASGPIECPNCGEQFFLPATEDEMVEPSDAADHNPDDELDGLRIRNRVTMMRSLYRGRSYLIATACAGGLGLVELLRLYLRTVKSVGFNQVGLLIIAVGIAVAAGLVMCVSKIAAFNREIRDQKSLATIESEPDFSPLSDGSQQAKNLERLR